MKAVTEFDLGCAVTCSDGEYGELRRVVLDPVARAVTHLVVAPRLRRSPGRLVPVDRVLSAGERMIVLEGTIDELEELDEAQESHLLSFSQAPLRYEALEMSSWPYMGLDAGALAIAGRSTASSSKTSARTIKCDSLPPGEVEVRRGDHVLATDGAIGHVKGLVVDPDDHHVTHVLLDEGHLWAHRRVTIPIGSVARVDDGVRVSLSRREVKDLPPAGLDGAPPAELDDRA
ncbi:MAG: PRC-barrel domain-containing protein [Solirubrobacteraceae bacterium]